jgi:polyphosphate kinase
MDSKKEHRIFHGRAENRGYMFFTAPGRPEPDPELFENYELSWLMFNWRVLHEAIDERTPLLERVKFIGIVKSNLDEFFQKRVGGLKRQLLAGVDDLSMDGKTPGEQLSVIKKEVEKMITSVREVFFDRLVPELAENGIVFSRYDELKDKHRERVDQYFDQQLYPILTPLVVDQAHPFPFISNKSRSFAVELEDPITGEIFFARIKIPSNRPRWLTVSKGKKGVVLLHIDELIRQKIDRLFPGAKVLSTTVFRVTRNADMARNEEEADDLLELIEEELRERRFADVVRLEIESTAPDYIRKYLMEKMKIGKMDVFEVEGAIGLSDAMSLYKISGYPHLRYRNWVPIMHPALRSGPDEPNLDFFSTIRRGDFIVHHPYHSFATSVQRFVEEAATDPNVLAIKQTLYRTSKDSALMHALMRAADAGKQIAVLVELKARFDEERNIEWAQRLERAGVHVAYGIAGLKIHCKMTIVVRQEGNKLCRYVHIGTGNYNPDTAQLYEDIGFFTCDEDIASDVTELFNFLTGYAPAQQYRSLLVAPHYMRDKITEYIDFEISEAREGRHAAIIMKMNNLEDPLIISKLYEASSAGVSVDCIVRSVCRLKPGATGLSENIRVHSVVGRFLEHSRVYYFAHGGEAHYYLGSADMMHRNLDARVESLVPVNSAELKRYLGFMFSLYLLDNRQRWLIGPNLTHTKIYPDTDSGVHQTDSIESVQEQLMNHVYTASDPIPFELRPGKYL